MNQTEKLALDYLTNTLGIAEDCIVFRNNLSPDFVVDKIGYEAKQLNGRNIRFEHGQLKHLWNFGECYILLFDDESKLSAKIPISELPIGVRKWRRFSIYTAPLSNHPTPFSTSACNRKIKQLYSKLMKPNQSIIQQKSKGTYDRNQKIKQLYQSGIMVNMAEIGKLYNITRQMVRKIIRRDGQS